MKQALKAFHENTYEIEEKLKNKVNILQTPVVLLNDSEIDEIKGLFTHLSQKIEKLSRQFSIKTSTNEEFFAEYHKIVKNYNDTRHKLEMKIEEFLKNREKLEAKNTRKLTRNFQISQNDNISEISDYSDKDHLEISRVFLNSIISSNQVSRLNTLKKLSEERIYIAEIFNLDINSQKEQILIDYYLNSYKFSLTKKFTIEKVSTFLSILYFLFNYSILTKKIIREKSYRVFIEILDFHVTHRPPYCFEIFKPEDKEYIIDYMKKTFFRNYTVYENIFKYNINIYLLSKDFKPIPATSIPKDLPLFDAQKVEDIPSVEFIKNTYIDRQKKVETKEEIKIKKKTEYERIEEHTLEKLRTFVSSFYKSKNQNENDINSKERERLIREIADEVEETEELLEMKIKEISKEVTEKVKIADKEFEKKHGEIITVLHAEGHHGTKKK
jgi:hypothetical protein